MNDSVRREILRRLVKAGHQIAPEALKCVEGFESPLDSLDSILGAASELGVSVITYEFIENIRTSEQVQGESDAGTVPSADDGYRQAIIEQHPTETEGLDTEPETYLIKNPTGGAVGSAGDLEDFVRLFNDRFQKLSRIYKSRADTMNALSPALAKSYKVDGRRRRMAGPDERISQRTPSQIVLGMVREKSVSRSHNVVVEIEDVKGAMTCIIPSGVKGSTGESLLRKGDSLLLDEVVCLSGRVDDGGRLITDDIIFPEVPASRRIGRAKRDVFAVFISDLHCGSKEFLESEFDRFIEWLSGRDVDSSERELVRNAEYLFIAGDLCDGVGVYPDQKENLTVTSIYDQYSFLAEKLRKLPQSIRMFCIPGNHDASRQALPRPPIPIEFAESLYAFGNRLWMLGDPCHLVIEGVGVLMTHGDSLDDLVTQIPGVSYTRPELGMRELLRKRHLAPIYGGKTELAPLPHDWLVIERVPDIIHFGHAHHNAFEEYRGVQIVNSGTFQGQTDFMRKQGVVPTPGIVTVVNLRTGEPAFKAAHGLSE